jgi:hypothetical protein
LAHPHPGTATKDHHTADQLAEAFTVPLEVAKRVLPDSPTPVLLGTGALALVGLIEWPVAAAIGLGYFALRRWHPAQ